VCKSRKGGEKDQLSLIEKTPENVSSEKTNFGGRKAKGPRRSQKKERGAQSCRTPVKSTKQVMKQSEKCLRIEVVRTHLRVGRQLTEKHDQRKRQEVHQVEGDYI